jgi:tRNA(adenine34) deaminase
MCTGAIILSRIENLYFATDEPKTGACGSVYNIPNENRLNHKVNIYSGIYELEAKNIMKNFFTNKRKAKNK